MRKGAEIVDRIDHVIISQMEPQRRLEWNLPPRTHKNKRILKQLPKVATMTAAVSLCIGAAVRLVLPEQTQAVFSHLTSGFEYDESIGRLQYVANILPESAMVFLDSCSELFHAERIVSDTAREVHCWSQEEPWIEYHVAGDIAACADGEIMAVVKNSRDTYTVRIMHDDGYESVYSGLLNVNTREGDTVFQGNHLGTAKGNAGFELRKDGLSVQPVFSEI